MPRKREAQAGYGPPSRRPSSRCQTARPAASAAQHISFPRRISAPGLSRRCSLSPPPLLPRPALRPGSRPNPWRQLQLRPRNEGPAERREASTLIRRAGKTRPHACEACPSRATGTSASRRSTVALPRPRCVSGIPPEPGQGWLADHRSWPATDPGFDRGYEPRPTPHPAPPSGSSPETPLMSEDDKSYTIYSLRSQ